jgi:hypothetical protein
LKRAAVAGVAIGVPIWAGSVPNGDDTIPAQFPPPAPDRVGASHCRPRLELLPNWRTLLRNAAYPAESASTTSVVVARYDMSE